MNKRAVDQKMKALHKAMKKLPEYKELFDLLPGNYKLNVEVEEVDQLTVLDKNVEYYGLTPNKGENAYMLRCCGEEYFVSSRSQKEIALEIQRAYQKVKESGVDISMRGFHISEALHDILHQTDEVYPHMRDNAVGVFKVLKLK